MSANNHTAIAKRRRSRVTVEGVREGIVRKATGDRPGYTISSAARAVPMCEKLRLGRNPQNPGE
jgi:hypothetical protein